MTGSLNRAIVVTGASTGIGRAVVATAAREGAHVFASVRKQPDADSLKSEFGDLVTPLLFDVADEAGVRAGAARVAEALGGTSLFGLVNNAGVAVTGPALYIETEKLRRQFEINLFGVHNVTRAFAPLLGSDPARKGAPGRIVMISSVAGQVAQPFASAYAASKHALEGYSTALRRELMLFGIDVVIIGPGAVSTPIWSKGEESGFARLTGTPYEAAGKAVLKFFADADRRGVAPSAVAALIWRALTAAKPKARYPILKNWLTGWTLPRLLPARVVDRIAARRLGFPLRS